jgi:hypothetical protein
MRVFPPIPPPYPPRMGWRDILIGLVIAAPIWTIVAAIVWLLWR